MTLLGIKQTLPFLQLPSSARVWSILSYPYSRNVSHLKFRDVLEGWPQVSDGTHLASSVEVCAQVACHCLTQARFRYSNGAWTEREQLEYKQCFALTTENTEYRIEARKLSLIFQVHLNPLAELNEDDKIW